MKNLENRMDGRNYGEYLIALRRNIHTVSGSLRMLGMRNEVIEEANEYLSEAAANHYCSEEAFSPESKQRLGAMLDRVMIERDNILAKIEESKNIAENSKEGYPAPRVYDFAIDEISENLSEQNLYSPETKGAKTGIAVKDFWMSLIPLFSKEAETKGLYINTSKVNGESLFMNQRDLKDIIHNLMTNAIKYTPEGEVALASDSRDGYVILTVEDSGIGIPMQEIAKLGTLNYRASNVGDIDGTGCGLNHVYDIVKNKYNGKVEIHSEEGKGTRVSVHLPK